MFFLFLALQVGGLSFSGGTQVFVFIFTFELLLRVVVTRLWWEVVQLPGRSRWLQYGSF